MIRRPPRSTPLYSSAASDVYKRQQHALQPNRWTPALSTPGVMGLNHLHQPAPGHHLLHLLQKHFAPCTLFLLLVLGLGKTDLGRFGKIHLGATLWALI